jgi:hypothetical protein
MNDAHQSDMARVTVRPLYDRHTSPSASTGLFLSDFRLVIRTSNG